MQAELLAILLKLNFGQQHTGSGKILLESDSMDAIQDIRGGNWGWNWENRHVVLSCSEVIRGFENFRIFYVNRKLNGCSP